MLSAVRMMRPRQSGFSLVELMIGLAAGLVVVSAVLAFTVATIRANNQNIQSARLTQDLRSATTFVERDLRRSGYDSESPVRIGQLVPQSPSSFTNIQVSGECVAYSYMREDGAAVHRAVRRNAGEQTLEVLSSTAAVTCASSGDWAAITDSDVVQISSFSVVMNPAGSAPTFWGKVGVVENPAGTFVAKIGCGVVRNINMTVSGQLTSDQDIQRQLTDEVRVRADPIVFRDVSVAALDDEPTCEEMKAACSGEASITCPSP